MTRWRLGAVVGILVLGSVSVWLRLANRELTLFERDEAAILRLAEDMLRLGRVPLSGPIFSTGIPSAPHFLYVLAPIIGLNRDPAFVAGAVAILNLAGLAGGVWLAWRWFGPVAAAVAGGLYATNPWAVFYARRIWQPAILPPLAVLLFIALDLAVIGRRPRWAALCIPLVALGVLIHPSFATLAPLVVAPVYTLARRRRWLELAAGCVGAAVVALPTLVHEVQTHWVDIPNLRYYASLRSFFDLDAVGYALTLWADWAPPHDAGVPPLDSGPVGALIPGAAAVELLLLAVGVGIALTGLRRGARLPQRLRYTALLVWLVMPVVLNIRHTFPLQAHYFLVTYPAPFLAIGAASQRLWQWLPARLVGLAAVAGLAGIQATAISGVLNQMAGSSADNACYGIPVRSVSALADDLVALGTSANGTHASVELDAVDSESTAYLLRGTFPLVDLAGAGGIGLGPRYATGAHSVARGAPAVFTGMGPAGLSYAEGVQVMRSAYNTAPARDGRVYVAVVWHVADSSALARPVTWDIALEDPAQPEPLVRESGIDHVPAQIAGQAIVSEFSIEPPAAPAAPLPAGLYRVRLRLIDTFNYIPLTVTNTAGQSAESWTIADIPVAGPTRC